MRRASCGVDCMAREGVGRPGERRERESNEGQEWCRRRACGRRARAHRRGGGGMDWRRARRVEEDTYHGGGRLLCGATGERESRRSRKCETAADFLSHSHFVFQRVFPILCGNAVPRHAPAAARDSCRSLALSLSRPRETRPPQNTHTHPHKTKQWQSSRVAPLTPHRPSG
jgi:hypothetical protein